MAAVTLTFKDRAKAALANPSLKAAIERTAGTAEKNRTAAVNRFAEFEAARERGRAIKDRGHERPDGRLDGTEPGRAVLRVRLGSDAEHDDRDLEMPDQLRQPFDLLLEARPEGVGERDDVGIEALVDVAGAELVRGEPVGGDLDVRDGQDALRRLGEDQVAAVAADQVLGERRRGRDGLERVLGGAQQQSLHASQRYRR